MVRYCCWMYANATVEEEGFLATREDAGGEGRGVPIEWRLMCVCGHPIAARLHAWD